MNIVPNLTPNNQIREDLLVEQKKQSTARSPVLKLRILALAFLIFPLWSARVEACSISGSIYGANGPSSFYVGLIDPNRNQWLSDARATYQYSFFGIPRGSFLVRVFSFSHGRSPVRTSPPERWVSCRSNESISNVDFILY
ncbi:MAG: hypothetical protein F6J96_32550 [Symploca sp. SIO1C2]|nr:hypothetical protein [Symploca sp. SIO1C2]